MTKIQHILSALLFICLLLLLGAMLFEITRAFQDVNNSPASIISMSPTTVVPSPTRIPATTQPKATQPEQPTPSPPPTWTATFTPSPWPTRTPIPPTPTETPTPLPARRPTAVALTMTPTAHPSITLQIPTAVPRQHIPAEAMTIVLLGSDQRPDWKYWNTDAIQYLVIYPHIHAVALLSIPRDLYVYIPNVRMQRINTAHMYGEIYRHDGGGLGLLNQTLLHNLGITADYSVKINFDGLIGLVNALGGIDVPVHCRLEDFWPYPDENGEYPRFVLEPGLHHLDGEQALWYSRSRKTTSVFSRERRQQQVLEAMWHKAKDTNLLAAAPELYEQTRDLYETDLGWGNIANLALMALQMNATDVRVYNIGWKQVEPYITFQGGNVYLPIWEEIEPIIEAVWAKPSSSRAAQAAIHVEVWNGTPHNTWEWLAVDKLAHAGFTPIIGAADRRDYPQTHIIFFGSTTKGSGLATVQQMFRVSQENVIVQENPEAGVKMRLILGQDYNPCPSW